MRIGIYDPYLDSLEGGEKYILTAASCLSEYHNVKIFWNPNEAQSIKQRTKDKFALDISHIPFEKNIFSKETPILQRLLISRRYDAIIFLSDGSLPFVLCKLYIHFQFPVEWVNSGTLLMKLKKNLIAGIFCNSLFTKRYIDSKFSVNSTLLYPPVMFKKSRNDKENIILHVGRFGRNSQGVNYKKQDVMIDAFKKMVNGGVMNWRLALVIGVKEKDKKAADELISTAKGFPIDIIVNPNNDQLWQYYSKAKIYWHASGFGEDLDKFPEKAEHFGIATVEAMSVGAVPVVINAGGQKEIVENGKSGFLWDTLEELMVKTEILMTQDQKREEMAREAEKKASEYNLEKFCNKLRAIVHE